MPTRAGIVASAYTLFDSFVFAGSTVSPYIYGAGYQGKPLTAFPAPASLPEGSIRGIKINSDKTVAAIAMSVTPFVGAYGFTGNGWGTRFSNPATLPTGLSNKVAWRGSSDVVVAHDTAPYATAYAWSAGFGTKYANPATVITTSGKDVVFNPAQDVIAISVNSGSTPFNTYVWSAGFGTKYANPASSLFSSNRVTFSPAGDVIAAQGATFVKAWIWSAGVGTKYADPAVPDGDGYTVEFNPAGNTIITSLRLTPYLSAWAWTFASGFGTKYAAALSYPMSSTNNAKFNSSGNTIAILRNDTRFYPFVVGTGFGTLISQSLSVGSGDGQGLEFI